MDSINVKIVGYTQPSEEFKDSFSTPNDLIAYCARVSNPSNQNNTQTSAKLLEYLSKHKHWSPFEMASLTLEVECPRDIARQFLRHRSFSFQEFSQRYSNPLEDIGMIEREARLQDNKNRQNSIELDTGDSLLDIEWSKRQSEIISLVSQHYAWAIENGIAKECARVILPEGNTMSRMYVQGSIRSWIHYLEVRQDPSTQKEHRLLAGKIAEVIAKVFN